MESVLWSAPEARRAGSHLLVMLHGYGSTEERMRDLFAALPDGVTGAALRGPFPVGSDYGWFLLDPLLQSDTGEVIEAGTVLLSRIDRLRREGGFTGVSLLGFSQGMAMAVTILRLRPRAFTAVVGLSGFVAENELLAMAEPLPEPVPFFWGRDRRDWMIHEDAVAHTAEWLEANTALTMRTYPGMGHRIGAEEVRDVGVFLRRYLA
ncbi:putative hydrolase [Arthrobacter saudimassiliensis]|uniref:Putative hydrolase n=1 Tax=Arthrobacter saudimassiliensis TaxID=1461584 RepID=A0A078MNV6_9MICC|nr:putative hydrolase [Arthrobacter saudimassiliensis]